MKTKLAFTIAALLNMALCYAQQQQQRQEVLDYIARYKDIALEEMVRCKIPASITLAQGIHESNCGKSPLSTKANNHFGIKCKNEWDGKKYYMDDDAPQECFRVYEHAEASYADHSDFLITRPRYAPLFQLDITDYKQWATGLKTYGYATNPKYAQILTNTIELYQLTQYDQVGLAMISEHEKRMNTTALPTQEIVHNEKKENAVTKPVIEKTEVQQHTTKDIIITEVISPEQKTTRKEYVVNGLKALKAEGNEDPLKTAFDYTIDYALILAYNDLGNGEHFKDGQYIYLQPKKNKGAESKYTVQAGESMHDIAQKFGIKLRELYAKNQMKPNDQLYAGQVVYLQEKRTDMPKTMAYSDFLKIQGNSRTTSLKNEANPAPAKSAEPVSAVSIKAQDAQYQVQQTDTLYSIARKFNTSVETLKALNNLESTDIKAGQTLVVAK
jgi:LysM repeat protein